jgi:predicted anti-sigma-YlaC factor YlaD
MSNESKTMTCHQFQALMPELIDAGEEVSDHHHVQNCAACRALLADLESIAEAARQLFPWVDPPDRVWEHIESEIGHESEPKQS